MAKPPKKRDKKYDPNKYKRPGNIAMGVPSAMFKLPQDQNMRIHTIPLASLFTLHRCCGDLYHIQAVEFRIRLIAQFADKYLEQVQMLELYSKAKSVINTVIERHTRIDQWRLLGSEYDTLSWALELAEDIHMDNTRSDVLLAYQSIQKEIQRDLETVYKVKE